LVSDKTAEVLLIEDNVDDATLIVDTLKKTHDGLRVELVQDGASALDFLFGTGAYIRRRYGATPDLIILDIRLPKLSGLEVLRVIRFYTRTQSIPVVIFTSTADEQTQLESEKLGVNSFVAKPTSIDGFRKATQQIAVRWLLPLVDQGLPVERQQKPDTGQQQAGSAS
jgi:two-component system, response regulator